MWGVVTMDILLMRINHIATKGRCRNTKRPTRLRLVLLTLVFAATSTFGDLLLFVDPSYAVSLTPITYEKVGAIKNCQLVQAGTTDGQNAYFACVNNSSHSSTELVKTELNGKELARSKSYSRSTVGHANAMAYNSSLKKLILTAWDDKSSGNNGITDKVRVIDPSNLSKVESTQTFNKNPSITNICYNATTDQYIVNGMLYDSNYRYIKTIFSGGDSEFNRDSQMSGDTAGQGIDCDNSHIYVIRWSHTKNITRIIAYDWTGKATAVYDVKNMNDEIESLFIVNGAMYAGVNNFSGSSSYIIKLNGITLGASTGVPITVGAFNVLGCNHTSGNVSGRMATLAKNINNLAYDVVGMSEYNVKECSGKLVAALASYGNWKDTKHYSSDNIEQTGIIYNADKVTLVSEEVLNTVSGCKTMNDYARGDVPGEQRGGSCYVRVAHFVNTTGTEFVVANGHFAMDHSLDGGKMREQQIKSVINKLASESIPTFIVGDTNAAPEYATSEQAKGYYTDYDHLFYDALASGGYKIAAQNTTTTKNGDWATIGDSEGSSYQIDQIFYRDISSPTYFEVYGCDVQDDGGGSCGSDHRPVKAVFGTNNNCDTDSGSNDTSTTNAYRAHNNALLTGSSASVCCATDKPSTPGDNTVLIGSSNAEKAFNFLTTTNIETNGGKPLNAAQAAGVVGNLMIETGGGTYDLRPDAVNSIGAAGIVQWYKGRRTALNNFAASKEKDWTDLKTQLQFMVTELESDYYGKTVMTGSKAGGKDINKGLANITDTSEASAKIAANIVGRWYETPSISDSYPNREDAAVKALKDFGGSATAGVTATNSGCKQDAPGDFSSTVESFVWEDGRRGAEQKGGDEGAYATAVKRSKYGNDANHQYGNDCGAFVYILMTESGFEPAYQGTNTDGQRAWLEANWEPVKFASGSVDVAELRAGDVAHKDGHVFVWIDEVEGFVGKSAEAALGSNTAPTAITSGNTYSDPSLYTWFRKKAN